MASQYDGNLKNNILFICIFLVLVLVLVLVIPKCGRLSWPVGQLLGVL